MGGLFLLSRRGGGAGGPGGFGGGNNPMQMGKSKAKFQMEPNTGITFDDVAGVNEAKEDFEEVRPWRYWTGEQGCIVLKQLCFTSVCGNALCARPLQHTMLALPSQVVEFLKRPERFTAVGAKIPKGVLLVGPPGTTLKQQHIAQQAAGKQPLCFLDCSPLQTLAIF